MFPFNPHRPCDPCLYQDSPHLSPLLGPPQVHPSIVQTTSLWLSVLNSKTLPISESSPSSPTRKSALLVSYVVLLNFLLTSVSCIFRHSTPLKLLSHRPGIIVQLLLGLRGRAPGRHPCHSHHHRRYSYHRASDRWKPSRSPRTQHDHRSRATTPQKFPPRRGRPPAGRGEVERFGKRHRL
jgi:hypothetical protein